jgi:uncharacterized protein (DUF427 family)
MVNDVQTTRPDLIAAGGRARALFEGHELADSARALLVTEPGGVRAVYFPAEDVQTAFLRRNDHATASPWFGAATWYTVSRDAKIIENVAWSYDQPLDDGATFAGYIAFAPEHVEIQLDEPAPVPRVDAHDPPYV